MAFLVTQWKYIVIALLLALLGVQQVRIDHAHTELAQLRQQFAEERQRAADAARKAEQDARETEERREQDKQQVIDAAEARIELAKADAVAASAAADSLRDRIQQLVANARSASSNPGTGKGSTPASDPLGMLAIMFDRIDRRAGVIAGFADQSRIAGLACETSYDGLRTGP